MIYELRIYEALPGRMAALHQRFANHTTQLFERHGIKAVGFWTNAIGGYSDQLIYLLAFDSLETRDRAWAAFQADPEWQKARAESEKDGPLVQRITNSILRATPYSPMT